MAARPVRCTLFVAALLALPCALRAQAPAAAFFAQPSLPVVGTSVRFLDTSANNPTSWLWDFGDPSSGSANSSVLQNPSHSFQTAGDYVVTLIASNSAGSGSFHATISVGPGVPSCVPNDTTLCLVGGRFSVTAGYVTTEIQSGAGHAVTLTNNSGYFWFFDPTNVEIVTKVLDGCSINNAYWVFAAGLTNAGVILNVIDTSNEAQYQSINTIGVPFAAIQATTAFDTSCP